MTISPNPPTPLRPHVVDHQLADLVESARAPGIWTDEHTRTLSERRRLSLDIASFIALDLPDAVLADVVARTATAIDTTDASVYEDATESEHRASFGVAARQELLRRGGHMDRTKAVVGLPMKMMRDDLLAHIIRIASAPDLQPVHQAVAAAIAGASLRAAPGASRVAETLRLLDADTADTADGPEWQWIRCGMALLYLSDTTTPHRPEGVARPDALTASQASRASRVFYRHGVDEFDLVPTPRQLDLTPADLGTAIQRYADACNAWYEAGWDVDALYRLHEVPIAEEPDRPQPAVQVLPESAALASAHEAGGCLWPLALSVTDDAELCRLWEVGLSPTPIGTVGLPVYSGGGDIRIRWGAPPLPGTLRVAVRLAPAAVLHIHRASGSTDDARFTRAAALAADDARRDGGIYASHLRRRLLDDGIRAIARYDHLTAPEQTTAPVPQEVILLDPSDRSVALVRESFPALRGARASTDD